VPRLPTHQIKPQRRRNSNSFPKPKIIDLFAGVGGFSLGAIRAGFDVVAAIDLDKHAIAGHKKNFPLTSHRRRNIARLSGESLLDIANLNEGKLAGIIGGPPCQGFSRIGSRRKNDKRNSLFYHFFRLISETKPLFFVAENVPGILDEKYDSLVEEALSLVCDDYDCLEPFKIRASDFGAATNRTRVFFVGTHSSLESSLSLSDFMAKNKYKEASVRIALAGLQPRIMDSWQNEESSWRQVDLVDSEYIRLINRRCAGSAGDALAIKRFEEKREISGWLGTHHQAEVVKRFAAVPAGHTEKISRYPRLSWEGLCPTLRAGTDSSRGSFQAVRPIHPEEPRVIAPREAARLQGFPDWFQFSPTKWHSFRQLGNSISPFVSEHVLKVIQRKISTV
jgi:DNA (cytosine-5)-methyltransferase 1